GESAGAGYAPMRWRRSARLIAVARTRTRASPRWGAGVGTSRSSSTSGPPGLVMTMARMAVCYTARPMRVTRPVVRQFKARFEDEVARHVRAGGHAVVWDAP